MALPNIVLIIYALFLFMGAVMGFKAGSKISLIAGLVSGALNLLGVFWLQSNAKQGYLFLIVLNGILTVMFLMRFLKTHKMMPSGMLLLVGLMVTVLCVVWYSHAQK